MPPGLLFALTSVQGSAATAFEVKMELLGGMYFSSFMKKFRFMSSLSKRKTPWKVFGENSLTCSLSDHPVGKDLQAMRTGQRQNKGMRTRLGCLSHKSDSCSDFTAILPDKPNRALKRLSTEEATRWADSFDVLLSHKYGVAAFRAFLKTEFSEENLEFWLACEEFKKTRSTAKLVSKAHRIFEEFVDVQAPREVNIDFQTREATRKNMQEPSLTCFDQAQGKVHSLMEKDSYPRFLRSKMYLDLLSQSQRRLS
ncbi:regulator of G-protein signaling 8 isoform X1 [Panthera pardus]|uniref:Regulator of G-protein signaling 8 n=1 Tax=Panthera pardus TaxID=9691 RepID=A0A9V1EJP4_PANPR|nr:regulator of G-protein signaling 8 isoform X1 [Panthera pardus]XP_060499748.1 regulator of G-protein signaling 8 isoform X3 [Panthera onca]